MIVRKIPRICATLCPMFTLDAQSRVNVSRSTVYEVLKQSERYNELTINPQLFLDKVVAAIRWRAKQVCWLKALNIQKINGAVYEMSLFHSEEIETYLDRLQEVGNYNATA